MLQDHDIAALSHSTIVDSGVRHGTELDNVLAQYDKYALSDLNNAALMRRYDRKFVFSRQVLIPILTALSPYYRALEINGCSQHRYRNYYYDHNNQFYISHHRGQYPRLKVRLRHYVDTKAHFLEVKCKDNRRMTVKQRLPVPSTDVDLSDYTAFLKRSRIEATLLQCVQYGQYSRIALANEEAGERVTFDVHMMFLEQGVKPVLLNHIVVAELKQADLNNRSPFLDVMRQHGIRQSRFSKYCIGSALTAGRPLKVNRFKPVLHHLSRLEQKL